MDKEALIFYQIYPKSFYDTNGDGIGDIQGIIEKIPYLVNLGINAVWLSPIYLSPMKDNGYDISDYYKVHPMFGSMDDLKTLIEKLHEANILLIMDLVINHTSSEHPWFLESKQSLDNPKRDFYLWKKGLKNGRKPPNNWTAFFTGSAWSKTKETDEYYLHIFSQDQPDLNWDNETVYQTIKTMIKYYLELGVDGFRMDEINLIGKDSQFKNGRMRIALKGIEHYLSHPKSHRILRRLHEDLFSHYDMVTIGECVFVSKDDALNYIAPKRKELDMVFHFDHMGVDNFYKWFIKKFKAYKLKKVLYDWQEAIGSQGLNAIYLENHDQPRSISRFGDEHYHFESGSLLATLIFTLKGIPFIYQGQELGMTNVRFDSLDDYRDVETKNVYILGRKTFKFTHKRMMKKIHKMSRDNARTPVQWDSTPNAGFSTHTPWINLNSNFKTLNIKDALKNQNSLLNYYKALIALRKQEPSLIYGAFKKIPSKKNVYHYERSYNGKTLIIILNHQNKTINYNLNQSLTQGKTLLSNYQDGKENQLRPFEAVIIKK